MFATQHHRGRSRDPCYGSRHPYRLCHHGSSPAARKVVPRHVGRRSCSQRMECFPQTNRESHRLINLLLKSCPARKNMATLSLHFPSRGRSARRRITYEVNDDLEWWKSSLSLFDGVLLLDLCHRTITHICTDASNTG